ncbi:DNA-binding transcriptional regulator, GntR family [Prauserella aidingensis]|uniref:GntR family transcriptional regulator n=1 Tax=Prauserella aidingensis TaxID=387890 RepID=UPI0020A460B7|nr:GntR family transcriptional regulator [Prauserella aidingensis]MCP2256149.1 DNA-binding transcriptional regulator, GntR family [Prauserella aidingensis]
MTLPSTEPRSLGDAAYQQLRADIVSCRLAPGQRLTERALAETTEFGISPIRDALTRLNHDGLVRTLPRKGYQVTPLTLKSVDDLFTLWQIVAPEIARLGIRDATAEQHQRLMDAFGRMAELTAQAGSREPETQLNLIEIADIAFGTLAAATQNDYLLSIFRRLQSDMARIWVLLTQADIRMPDLGVDQRWTQAIERRDGDAAAETVRAALAEAHGNALRIFSRWPSVAASEITPLPL